MNLSIFAFCLSIPALFLPEAAIADLAHAQMDSAKLNALSGKMLNLPDSCPAVDIPAAIVKTKSEFDKLEMQLKGAQYCVAATRKMTKQTNAIALATEKYPAASKAQIDELVDIMLLSARPVLEKHEAALSRVENDANGAALPFMRRQELQQSIETEYELCEKEKPEEHQWKSWVAADIFLTQYAIFDRCVKSLFATVESMNPAYVVKTNFSQDSSTVQTYLLKEIPNIQEAALKEIAARLDAAASSQARAKKFAIKDRADDAKSVEK